VFDEYKDKSDKNMRKLYGPYREEKNKKDTIELIKLYYQVGKKRYPVTDPNYGNSMNPALWLLMLFRNDLTGNPGPY
jgi:hypothetical protein